MSTVPRSYLRIANRATKGAESDFCDLNRGDDALSKENAQKALRQSRGLAVDSIAFATREQPASKR